VPGPIRSPERFAELSTRGAKPARRPFIEYVQQLEEERKSRPNPRDLQTKPVSERLLTLSQPKIKAEKPNAAKEATESKTKPSIRDMPAPPLSPTIQRLADTSHLPQRERFEVALERRKAEEKARHERIAKLNKEPENEEYWKHLATPLRPLPRVMRKTDTGSPRLGSTAGSASTKSATQLSDSMPPPQATSPPPSPSNSSHK